jgi:hypothetical protein
VKSRINGGNRKKSPIIASSSTTPSNPIDIKATPLRIKADPAPKAIHLCFRKKITRITIILIGIDKQANA